MKIGILGAGAMGTACALLLTERSSHQVRLWGRDRAKMQEMNQQRENRRLLPGLVLPAQVEVTSDLVAAIDGVELVVIAIPTQHLRSTLQHVPAGALAGCPIVSMVKGIENGTFLRPSQILSAQLGTSHIVVVSGPSHAEEIGRRLPATVVAASPDFKLAELVQQLFTTERFRVYTNPDVIGVELAGAIKNVIAIAAGISDGLGYGDNSKSAILTRGLVEMTRFGQHAGAKAATFTGLAGLGDLVTTCVSPYGRNLSVGRRLGAGESLSDILGSLGGVAEGVSTARSVHEIALRDGIEMPITAQVYAVVTGEATPRQATSNLMQRPLREE